MAYLQSWLDVSLPWPWHCSRSNNMQLEKSMGGRMVLKGSAEDIRAQIQQLIQILLPQLPPPSDAVESKDGEVDGIKYRLYTPKEASKQGPLPVAIRTHGGGWATGDLNTDDLLCRIVAEHAPSIVVNVDYRLAPEHKVPTQLEDTLTVYNWATERNIIRWRLEQVLQHWWLCWRWLGL